MSKSRTEKFLLKEGLKAKEKKYNANKVKPIANETLSRNKDQARRK